MLYKKLLSVATASLVVLSFSACQKNESAKSETAPNHTTASTTASVSVASATTNVTKIASATTAATTASTSPSTTNSAKATTIPTLTPYMQFIVDTNQGLATQMIEQEHPKLSEKQKLCLKSAEGWSNYVSILKPYTEKILSPQEIAEANKFYTSSVGMQFAMQMKKQIGTADPNMPSMPLSDEQKKELAIAMTRPFMTKMQLATDKMSEADSAAFAKSMMDLEVKRCHIQ